MYHTPKSLCAVILFGVLSITLSAGAVAAPVECSVIAEYARLTQSGDVLDSHTYEQIFEVEPGLDYFDDFSTATRTREFLASAKQRGLKTMVTIAYFNDVGTFESIDFGTQLTLRGKQLRETMSGHHTFSTSRAPLSGHFQVDYSLTCHR